MIWCLLQLAMMHFKLNSLKTRLFLAILVILPVSCGFLGYSLDEALKSSLLQSQQKQMVNQAYALMASAELDNKQLWLPELLTDDNLNQVSSGIYASVYSVDQSRIVWKSQSNIVSNTILETTLTKGQIAKIQFTLDTVNNKESFILHYYVQWETRDGTSLPFIFSVFESQDLFKQQLASFRETLWRWLLGMGLSVLALLSALLAWGLKPLTQVSRDLQQVKLGEIQRLTGNYPSELEMLSDSINQLIEHERIQREKHRNKLSDLAHSIKNPVAIIARSADNLKNVLDQIHHNQIDEILEQNERINQIISYQLSRAVGQSFISFHQAIPISPIVTKILSAMQKVYSDKNMLVTITCDEHAIFRGDQGDLMELLGNLIDNAFKYGKKRILVTVTNQNDKLLIAVEDDGPGISPEFSKSLLKRGVRADETMPGQGIGLAVVEDITLAYKGNIELDKAKLGGLRARLTFQVS